MKNKSETIEAIAQESASRIIEEAEAQGITNTQEVHDLIVKLLSDEKTYAELERDSKAKAKELLFMRYRWRDEVLNATQITIDMLTDYGLDYAGLTCLVEDGEEFGDLEKAIKKCIVDGWGPAYAEYAKEAWLAGNNINMVMYP